MKVLFISHRIPYPPNKGEKIRTYNQIRFLADRGHTVFVASPFESESELAHFRELEKLHCQKSFGAKLGNKPIRLLGGLLSGKALSVANFYNKDLQVSIDRFLSEESPDAVICTASSVAEYVFRSKVISKMANKPTLMMDFMDLDSDKWRQYAAQSGFPMKWVYQREANLILNYEKKIAEYFDASLFVTEAEVALFEKFGGSVDKVHAIENGMDTDEFQPTQFKDRTEAPVCLFTGVMDYSPNIDAVVWFVENTWSRVLEKWPDARFFIAGMNPTEKVKALERYKGVTVTGFVEDIRPYFDQATIFVAPFRIARGVQNKVLQAFACGLPVVATPMGAEGIRYEDGKNILLANDSGDFLARLVQLTEDKALHESISIQALETIHQHYSWKSILAPFETLLSGTGQAMPGKRINANEVAE
ncbi:TIGR03087 family PEP-CTERM/XrtA system glycosyltransferase [Hahella ganghwensis]|uniref:TIGR03087 family PEP-CTERM/XrtA system glycosyltransferase n=1 Tax=Hahella ganghwensis TaxID=286420 RepID=UPI000377B871|nr:TIGR03087 family PEP-CTERM/XrtA system glycosyltransferase [Hahella ganghwensis]